MYANVRVDPPSFIPTSNMMRPMQGGPRNQGFIILRKKLLRKKLVPESVEANTAIDIPNPKMIINKIILMPSFLKVFFIKRLAKLLEIES